MAASLFFKHKRLLLSLPRQYGGKTELGVRLLHDLTERPFTSSSLFLAKDKKSGKKATREKFERIFDKNIFNVNTENVHLKKCPTSVIWMDSVDKDPDRIRGGTYSMIHWSEVAFSKIEKGVTIAMVFDKIIQPTLRLTEGYALLESTNNGKNGWWDIWNSAKDFGFKTLRFGLSDMVAMGLVSIEVYNEIQKTTHPDVFRQEYECEWVSFAGRVYNEFNESIHVDEAMPPPESWQTTVMAIDWGYSPSATCVLFAYVQDGVINVFDEHYATEELAAITAERIESILYRWKITKKAAVADHEEDRMEELRRRGIECGLAKKTDVMGARIEIKERLYFNKIKFHPRCKYVLRDLASATWHPKKEGELDDSQCTWGHFDGESTLRYLVREFGEYEQEAPKSNPHRSSLSEAAHEIERLRDAD